LDLALEALRSAAAELYRASSYCNTYEVLGNTNDAITAIQQALAAQPAPVQSCYCPNCEAMGKELAALKAHLTEEKKVELATNWFAEDWAITKAVGMLHDYDKLLRKTTPPAAPVAWKWHQAPVKTSWGHDIVVADLAIDKDNTVSVYCERDQTTKVEAMFTLRKDNT
jgi:hypothetical protein